MWRKDPRAWARVTVAALLVLSLCGCLRLDKLRHPGQSIQYYSLEYPAPSALVAAPLADVLRLKRFEVMDAFATDRIVYERAPFSPASDYYDRWTVSPGAMVTGAVLRDLTASGIFRAVVTGRGSLLPDYELTGTLETLRAKREGQGWQSEIVIHVLFYPHSPDKETPPRQRIFQKRYVITTPCQDPQALSVVQSLSTGLESFSGQMLLDVAGEIQKNIEEAQRAAAHQN